ncbi:MAG: DUF1275 domain-containing protein [Reyranella sp.]|nr:DUF1275 domain-containing protein [Reyranella sp.]
MRPLMQAGLLTIVAGMADAVGYVAMGGVFAANMTGNTVLAGMALGQGDVALAAKRMAPLGTFFLGAMLARLLLRLGRRQAVPLLLEAVVLAVVDFLPIGREPALLLVALAMGLQASAITHFAGTAVSTVVVTSTLARIAEATLDRAWPARHPPPSVVMGPRLLALTWTGYLVGAVAGVLLIAVLPWPLIVPAALLLMVVATL